MLPAGGPRHRRRQRHHRHRLQTDQRVDSLCRVTLCVCVQAMALLDAAALGQQLQQLAGLQAAHAAAGDLAPLQAFCSEVLSQRNSGGPAA